MIIKPILLSHFTQPLFNIENPYFEEMVNQIDPPELQLNKAYTSNTEPSFWVFIYLFLMVLFPPKFMITR